MPALITLRTDKQVDTTQPSGGESRETLVIDEKPQRCIRLESRVHGRDYVVFRCRAHNPQGRAFVALRPKAVEGAHPVLFDMGPDAVRRLGERAETQHLVIRMLRILERTNVSFTAP